MVATEKRVKGRKPCPLGREEIRDIPNPLKE